MVESDPPHPLAHIESLKCYEWMLAECAALNANRQARQDGLIATIIQISSAAILAIPGLLFASSAQMPTFRNGPFLYVGIISFGLALVGAMAEQHFSAIAYDRQIEVVQAYYTKRSANMEHTSSRLHVKRARGAAYFFFAVALLTSSIGLINI
jgi:hypothetical protein